MASPQHGPPTVPPPYTEYEGISFPALVTKENLEAMKTFEMRDGDVVVLSYPKSGTHWVHQIVHEIFDGKSETSPINRLELCLPGKQPFHVQLRESPSPRLMETHLPFHMAPPGLRAPRGKVKVVVVLRNPKDVCVSLYHFGQKNPFHKTPESLKQHAKDFLDGNQILGDYFDHVLGWWQKKDDPHFLFVKYEDMKKDLASSVKEIATFLEKDLTDEDLARVVTNCSLDSMRKNLAKSEFALRKLIVRKGVVGDWKNHFSDEESAKFDQKYRERMSGSGLEFDFE